MNHSPAIPTDPPPATVATRAVPGAFSRGNAAGLLVAAAAVPVSLVWDFSWESTVGVDRVWAPPHTATYLAVAAVGILALRQVRRTTRDGAPAVAGVRCGFWHAPLGAWLALWGAATFVAAFLFDRWWQSAYGLGAGIWHPPQILKAIAFFVTVSGAWLLCLRWQNAPDRKAARGGAMAFAAGGGLVLALITVMTLPSIYPNRQHAASFYQLACAVYPLVLAALTAAGKLRWPATAAAIVYLALVCPLVWVLPRFPATPQVGPVYHPLDHLMPPPFPLLLVFPAMGLDALLRRCPWPAHPARPWLQAATAGVGFFVVFLGVQWLFAEFLLSDLADNWFFAGGGRHWPFFLKLSPQARVEFWETPGDELNFTRALIAAGLAVLAARLGLAVGAWMTRVRR